MIAAAAFAVAVAAAPAHVQPASEQGYRSRAIELFERDWALMHWGLKYFDRDGDRTISVAEAHAAALEFKRIADGDGDGRVTPYEYERAREFIIARY